LKSLFTLLTKPFKDKTELAMFFTAFFIEVAFGIYLVYRWGFTFVSGDAISHLYIPRTVIDNGPQSNLANLGTVWLPMFHLLVMPLVWINPLYSTGLAGTIVNGLATAGICIMAYRLIGDKKLGILASILFLSNAYTLTYGATPMMEQTAIFFMALAVYYFKRYWEKDSLTEFMKCSLALILGTLTRYEVWAVAFLVIFFFALRELRNGQGYRLAYVHLPLWGIFAWLFWNLAVFRDPLAFRHILFASNTQYTNGVILTLQIIVQHLFKVSGMLGLATTVSIILLLVKRKRIQPIVIVLLLSPIAFHFSHILLTGSGAKITRYFLLGFFGLIASPFLLLREIKKTDTKITITAFLLSLFLLSAAYPIQASVITHFSPSSEEAMAMKEVVGDRVILISSWTNIGAPSYSVFTETAPSLIIDDHDGQLYLKAMDSPWNYCEFVAITKLRNATDSRVQAINDYYGGKYFIYRYYNDEVWRSLFLSRYSLILETKNYLLYQLSAEEL